MVIKLILFMFLVRFKVFVCVTFLELKLCLGINSTRKEQIERLGSVILIGSVYETLFCTVCVCKTWIQASVGGS